MCVDKVKDWYFIFVKYYLPKIASSILVRVTMTAGIKPATTETHIIISALIVRSAQFKTKTALQIGRTNG